MFKALFNRLSTWRDDRRRRRVERLTARAAALEDGTPSDLLFLHEQGFVRTRPVTRLLHAHFIVAMTVVLGAGAAGCAGPAASTSAPATSPVALVELAPASDCTAPTRVAVLLDKTTSIDEYAIEQPTLDDFRSLIAALRRCGGEIAVGAIRDATRDPLVRLDVPREIPPPACTRELASGRASGNPLITASRTERCRRQERTFAADVAVDDDELAARTGRFDHEVSAVLDEAAIYRRTELWKAIEQANTFLNEPSQHLPDTVLILVSDGLHTTRTPPVDPAARILVVVNGLGHTGDLGDAPARFSSVRAAFHAAVPPAAMH